MVRARANDACTAQHSQRVVCAQIKSAAKIMVTVVATQALKPGDELRRFKAKAAHGAPRRGNDKNQCTAIGLAVVVI